MKCSVCTKSSEFYCPCQYVFLCPEHVGPHMLRAGQHLPEQLVISLTAQEMKSLRKEIMTRTQKIDISKGKFLSFVSDTIKKIESFSLNALEELDRLEQRFLNFLLVNKMSISLKNEVKNIIETSMTIKEFAKGININFEENIIDGLVQFEKNLNYLELNDKLAYIESLNIPHFLENFSRFGAFKFLVMEIKFSDDSNYFFVCNYLFR